MKVKESKLMFRETHPHTLCMWVSLFRSFFLHETQTNLRVKLKAELIKNVDSVVAKSHFESVKSCEIKPILFFFYQKKKNRKHNQQINQKKKHFWPEVFSDCSNNCPVSWVKEKSRSWMFTIINNGNNRLKKKNNPSIEWETTTTTTAQ